MLVRLAPTCSMTSHFFINQCADFNHEADHAWHFKGVAELTLGVPDDCLRQVLSEQVSHARLPAAQKLPHQDLHRVIPYAFSGRLPQLAVHTFSLSSFGQNSPQGTEAPGSIPSVTPP